MKSLIGYEPHTTVDVDQKNMSWFVGFARRFYTIITWPNTFGDKSSEVKI